MTGVTNSKDLRAYAARLLALASKARRNGDAKYADWLAAKAAEHLDQASKLENAVRGGLPTEGNTHQKIIGRRVVT